MTNFEEMTACIRHSHIYIQTHNFPDPDAIASAYGLQYLLGQRGIRSTICYKGKVDYGSSNKMVYMIGIDIVEFEEMETMSKDAEIILVDAQKGNANIIDLPGTEILCIDHHPTFEKVDYEYADIRPEVGACASIIASYFFENGISMNKSVATALLYGIKIDTANLTRGVSKLDLDMFYRMFHMVDKKLIEALDTSVLRRMDLKAYANAINSIKFYGSMSFANTGAECPESLIAAISDFIMMIDTIDVTVVYSIKSDGIKISMRSSGRCNAGRVANEALKGIGNGGGHENMAGGFVPYRKDLPNASRNEAYIAQLIDGIENRFVKTIEESDINS